VPEFQVLMVCTANICRSPAAATLLGLRLGVESAGTPVEIRSVGTQALAGRPACGSASELVSQHAHRFYPNLVGDPDPQSEHRSRLLLAEHLRAADLVLGLDREHRSHLAAASPADRPKTFTLRQAAELAGYVAEFISVADSPAGAPPMPSDADPKARLSWLVVEMDAARGIAPATVVDNSPTDWHPLDVPDPHVLGQQLHPDAFGLILAATDQLGTAMRTVLDAP
jgi:protein-tyrosine phosphatase